MTYYVTVRLTIANVSFIRYRQSVSTL